jgi:hypothetical protein
VALIADPIAFTFTSGQSLLSASAIYATTRCPGALRAGAGSAICAVSARLLALRLATINQHTEGSVSSSERSCMFGAMSKTTMPAPRDLAQRKADTLAELANENDIWVATVGASCEPCLVPLSYAWVDGQILLATAERNRTARNVSVTGTACLALGPTRDVVLLEGGADVLAMGELGDDHAARFSARTGWDPRDDPSLVWIVFRPRRVQAWRSLEELDGRAIMEGGRWLA